MKPDQSRRGLDLTDMLGNFFLKPEHSLTSLRAEIPGDIPPPIDK